ncbi:methyltransferase family protein [Aequorivita capsosiphonis]|uniref:methyltransferase family protein n=1 Tax=Aequorivita capsosiphonis TaxID=487317 RepID=UPI000A04DBB6|nr:isoprenylcysteine carboxylmethyltransferase family protein [Aequorivita capsosiphonis]
MKIPFKDIVFVLLQFLLFIAFTFDIESMTILFPPILFWFGVGIFVLGFVITVVAVLQLNVNLSPFPSPLPGAKLIETGVYKFVRHPIYTGLILAFFGYSIISDSGYRLLITTLLFLLFYFKTRYEEKQLIEKFPNYSEYKKRSGRFFPWV